jgi:hypothetical protein
VEDEVAYAAGYFLHRTINHQSAASDGNSKIQAAFVCCNSSQTQHQAEENKMHTTTIV